METTKQKNSKILKKIVPLLFFVTLALTATWRVLRTPGTLGHQWDWSIPSEPAQVQQKARRSISAWGQTSFGSPRVGLGAETIVFDLLTGLPGFLGLGGEVVSKGLVLLTVFLSGVSFYLLGLALTGERTFPALLGGTVYALSPFLFNEFHGGGATQFLSYALLPLALTAFIKQKFLATVISVALISMSLQNLLFTVIIFILWSLFNPQHRSYLKFLAKVGAATIILCSYWIIPFLAGFQSQAPQLLSPAQLTPSNLTDRVPSIDDALLGLGYFEDFAKNTLKEGLGIYHTVPLLLSLTVLLYFLLKFKKKKGREAVFWLGVFILFLIPATAARSPLGKLMLHLYQRVPLMNLFRSPQHFLTVTTLSLAVVILLSLHAIYQQAGSTARATALSCLLILPWISPFLTGDLGRGLLKKPGSGGSFISLYQPSPRLREVWDVLEREQGLGRVFFYPPTHSPYYLATPWQEEGQGAEPALVFHSYGVLLPKLVPSKEVKGIFKTLRAELSQGDNLENFNNFAKFAAIKYFVLRNDIVDYFGDYAFSYYQPAIYQKLTADPGWELLFEGPEVSFWQFEDFEPKFILRPSNVPELATESWMSDSATAILPVEITDPDPLSIKSPPLQPALYDYSLEIEARGRGLQTLVIREHSWPEDIRPIYEIPTPTDWLIFRKELILYPWLRWQKIPLQLRAGTAWFEGSLETAPNDFEISQIQLLATPKPSSESATIRPYDTAPHRRLRAIKLSPTSYKVELTPLDSPQKLIFKETFDLGWELVSPCFKHPPPHQKEDDFFNSWTLEPENFSCRDPVIEIEVEYKPQRILKIGWATSGAALLVLMGLCVYQRSKN